MYERLLDKQRQPTFEEMLKYCGGSGGFWMELENYLQNCYNLTKLIRFPYGKDYGWSVKYGHGGKHICDIFAEAGAFTVFFKIADKEIDGLKNELCGCSLKVCDDKYPCAGGGWLSYRVLESRHVTDVKKLLATRVKPK